MKKLTFIILAILFLTSCENPEISKGRNAYKEYLSNTLKDPESLKIYDEKIVKKDTYTYEFTVDYGAKNSYGAYVRTTDTFLTISDYLMKVNGDIPQY